MKLKVNYILFALLVIPFFSTSLLLGQNPSSPLKIWFNKPAETWNDALPVGNGSLGAMVFGNVENERLEIN